MLNVNYNPDVLSCLANLSSDEVFTPPNVANQMLDLLPDELWSDKNAKFLDPATKSGVFLREIAKRLMIGLEKEIPDLQSRVDHIMTKQLFGIGITELTSLLARRSLYCSKVANGEFSICQEFDEQGGNIFFDRVEHKWKNGKCIYCGATQKKQSRDETLETHAYQFIHDQIPERIKDMKFDVIIGNPPYQLEDGGAKSSASPIYQRFVEQAQKLNPRFLSMIIPARWYSGGKGLENFRTQLSHDKRIRSLVDYFDSTECFPGVDISGGVCYFLWDRDNPGDCTVTSRFNGAENIKTRKSLTEGQNIFIRFNEGLSIVKKVEKLELKKFRGLVSSRKPFGIPTNAKVRENKEKGDIFIYGYPKNGYVNQEECKSGENFIKQHKVFISYAYGERGSFPYLVLGKPFVGEPNTVCTETYLAIGPFETKEVCENVLSYMNTKFFRFLVLLRKNTQHATSHVYDFVPQIDFNRTWDDDELNKMFGLSRQEAAFIDLMVREPS